MTAGQEAYYSPGRREFLTLNTGKVKVVYYRDSLFSLEGPGCEVQHPLATTTTTPYDGECVTVLFHHTFHTQSHRCKHPSVVNLLLSLYLTSLSR